MILKTKRLILRPWTADDAEGLYEYAKDPAVGPAAGWPAHTSAEDSREVIRNVLSAEGIFAVCLRETGGPVGSIGLVTARAEGARETEREVGYWIGKPYWGQGLIPEAVREIQRYAFEELGCTALWCAYFEGNEKSRRVQEKCGFRPHHTEHVFWKMLNEEKTEHYTYLTKDEWEKERKAVKKTFCGFHCEDCPSHETCPGCAATDGSPFGGGCVIAECCRKHGQSGCAACGSECALKTGIIAELETLGVHTDTLNALVGSYVNLEYPLPNGGSVRLLNDGRIYLGNQLECEGAERCTGVVADDRLLLVAEYGEMGSEPELAAYKRRG